MRIEGSGGMMPIMDRQNKGNEAAAVQRQIQGLQRDLNQLEQKQELTKEEEQEKKKLEKQIAELQQKLQKIRAEENEEKQDVQKKREENPCPHLKEEGRGRIVDASV